MSDRNREIIELLSELVLLATLEEGSSQSFRVRAYENAVHELELVREDIAAMSEKELVALEGIGKSTAKKIREYVETGAITKLEELRAAYPPSFVALSRIPGLGPKSLQKLRAELGIENLADLRAAIEAEQIRTLPGFGKKTEEKLAAAIARIGDDGKVGKDRRTPIAEAMPVAEAVVARIRSLPQTRNATCCGSLRRFRDTVADVDIVAVSTDPVPIMEAFVTSPEVAQVLGHGDTKSSTVTRAGLQLDLRVVEPAQEGAAILYFTGSKAHNIALRQRALERGWTLNEYGLTVLESGAIVAQETEQAIYEALEMDWVPAPMREDTGEVMLAARRALPAYLRGEDLRGDVIGAPDAVATAARARGYGWSVVLGGLADQRDPTALIAREVRVARDGSVPAPDGDPDADRAEAWIAVVEDHFDLPASEQTTRVCAALAHPRVSVLAAPTGRLIGTREPMELDFDRVIVAANEHRVALEIRADLARLDPPAELLRRAHELEATFLLATRAQTAGELDRAGYGVSLAQRAWVTRDRVLNTWDADRALGWLRRA
ncbi:MAG TPA: helix-hairpin-helix domain-containing protein [Kofleriaceae bacterium]|nr:helix-hairpin-helix domain-containing protein [Kofleriaceae bacterium]